MQRVSFRRHCTFSLPQGCESSVEGSDRPKGLAKGLADVREYKSFEYRVDDEHRKSADSSSRRARSFAPFFRPGDASAPSRPVSANYSIDNEWPAALAYSRTFISAFRPGMSRI